MKLKALLITCFIFLFILALPAKDNGYVVLRGNFYLPTDSNYKSVYGSSIIMPGIGGGVKIVHNIFFFADVDYLAKTGTTIGELQDPAKTRQMFASGGLEMRLAPSAKFTVKFRAGAAYISYEDEVFSETTKGNGFGFTFGTGLDWKFKSFFLALDINCLRATDTPFNNKVVLGGIKMALGIGRFF